MMTSQETVATFFVDPLNHVDIKCPKCGFVKTINASGYKYIKNVFNVRCKCGHTFQGIFNFKRSCFKQVNLDGEVAHKDDHDSDLISVHMLSMEGIGFRTMNRTGINEGDILDITFTLDNARKTEISRKVKVTSIKDNNVGARFHNRPPYDPDLGFYLMP